MGQIAFSLLAALLLVATAASQEQPDAPPADTPDAAEEFPSVEEALSRQIHGKYKTGKKGRLQVFYDFKDADQAGDFRARSRAADFAEVEFALPTEKLEHDPGKLYFPGDDSITSNIPMQNISLVTFRAMGVDELNIVLRGGGMGLFAELDHRARIYIGETENFDWAGDRRLNLNPKKLHRFEVLVGKSKAFVKLDGKKVLETKLPRDFPFMETLQIRTGTNGKPYVTELHFKGRLSDLAVVIAANRDRYKAKKPPIWPETFRADGDHFTVLTPVSQALADEWYRKLDAQATSILARYPPPAKKAGLKRSAYIFAEQQVYDAYTSGAPPLMPQLPDGTLAFLASGRTAGETRILWLAAHKLIDHSLPAASYWWKMGHATYYAYASQDGDSVRFGTVSGEAAAAARDHVERKADPRLSALLAGEEVKEYKPAVWFLCWAWVSFLEHGDGGAHQGYLRAYHKAITEGNKSGREAGAEVFPVERFNELFPQFEIYLEGL